jgi:hypothetical protein
MVLTWVDYVVIAGSARHHRVRIVVRAVPENHAGLLHHRTIRAVVGVCFTVVATGRAP